MIVKMSQNCFKDYLRCGKTLYPGCRNFTKLSALVKLNNLKTCHGWFDKKFKQLFTNAWRYVASPYYVFFFFHLVLILGFQARLMLETCRKYCLEQNPFFFFFFMVFGAHLMGFWKLRLILVLHFMCFCVIFRFRLKDWCLRMVT